MPFGGSVAAGESIHRYHRRGGDPGDGLRDALADGAPSPEVAIIGGGAGGLAMAIQLQLAGCHTFTLFEKSDGVGGTWRDNSYPGSGCDVPSHLYSFSFASKADWTRKFPEQAEILDYFESLVPRFELGPHLRLETEITEVTWSEETGRWTLTTVQGSRHEADVVVSGLGQLNRPYIPDIPGLSEFEGTTFHSARWDHDHDLRGERVGVIGIGASAIQFVPRIAREARQLTLFQRSANYVGPKRDRPFRRIEKLAFTHLPFLQRAYRQWIYWRYEARFSLFKKNSRLGAYFQRMFTKLLQPMIETGDFTSEALVPDYPPGCRRILTASDWYPTLMQPHVSVVTEGVDKIGTRSIVTTDGVEHPVDTIIFGTGFATTEFLAPMKVTGRRGADLNEVWGGAARAYLGLSIPQFPNFFMLYGPNTNLGHNSILFMIEQQVAYTLSMLELMARRKLKAVDVTDVAMERYDQEIQELAGDTVWAEGCHSWYKNSEGRITNNWVSYTVDYRKRLSKIDLHDWDLEPV